MTKGEDQEQVEAPKAEAKTPGEEGGRGKRERKQVEHYKPQTAEKAEFVIKKGKGEKLGEIPNGGTLADCGGIGLIGLQIAGVDLHAAWAQVDRPL